ncbi:hypothetical protein Goshw_003393 [Gossypium schwendimanii]|uniref:Retrotransposon gag domain-containing protein n=1 Tax=Gossypium schwendimanii TaxID=34291 RepID=A0A7J9LTE3_GOSSC|nr:hypothetical protein [Gossypium schwendimanii]
MAAGVTATGGRWIFGFNQYLGKKYIGELYLEDRKQEFLLLKQGDLSVVDYEREYMRLSKYAVELVPTEEENCKRFLCGMRDEIRIQSVALKIKEFVDLSKRAKMVEQYLGLSKKSEPSRVTGK